MRLNSFNAASAIHAPSSRTSNGQQSPDTENPGPSKKPHLPSPLIKRATSFPALRNATKFFQSRKFADPLEECEWDTSNVKDHDVQIGLYLPERGERNSFYIAVRRVHGKPYDGLAISLKTGREMDRLKSISAGEDENNLQRAWVIATSDRARMNGGSSTERTFDTRAQEMEYEDLVEDIEDWKESENPAVELDLSSRGATILPPLPPTARHIDISDNKLSELPSDIPAATISLVARENNIKRLPEDFLESIFSKTAECYFDFLDNPLEADQVRRIREVTRAPGYCGPKILYTAPTEMVDDDVKRHLTDVGESKLVGYLPNDELAKFEGLEPELQGKGIKCITFNRSECLVSSGALYAYDTAHLAVFLSLPENKQVLDKYGVPSTPDGYIQYIASNLVGRSEKPDLHDLIALTFNDPGKEYDNRRVAVADLVQSY
jgi:hypothetical protein